MKIINNRYLLFILLFIYGFGLTNCGKNIQSENRYNILFISVDDLNTELGIYGKEYVDTPNIDQFASQGVTFNHHYVQVVSCGPSRYALLTGRSPANTGVTINHNALFQGDAALNRQQTEGAQSFPELFRRSGYYTVGIGKISHHPDGKIFSYDGSGDGRQELPHAWDELPTPYGAWERGWGTFFAYADGKHREDGQNNRDLMEFIVEDDDDLPDGMMATMAIDKLSELKNRDQPFLLGVGFFKPHLPFVAPKQDWEAVQKWDVPPTNHPDRINSPYWSRSGEFYQYDMPFPNNRPLSMEDQMTVRRAYLANVRYIDRQVGRILNALDDEGLSDNTIVVLWSDHGFFLGEFEIWGKHTTFERASRSPLIIRAPDVREKGRTSGALVETIDLFPTLVDLTNPSFYKTEHALDGVSLVPVLKNETDYIRDGAITYWRDTVSIRTQNHRLISTWNGEAWTDIELYDMTEGPDSSVNIADENPELVEKMLNRIQNQTGKL